MGVLLDRKKRAKKKAFKATQERIQKVREEQQQLLELEFHNQRNEPITVLEIFNVISEVLNESERYRVRDELKRLLLRRAE